MASYQRHRQPTLAEPRVGAEGERSPENGVARLPTALVVIAGGPNSTARDWVCKLVFAGGGDYGSRRASRNAQSFNAPNVAAAMISRTAASETL